MTRPAHRDEGVLERVIRPAPALRDPLVLVVRHAAYVERGDVHVRVSDDAEHDQGRMSSSRLLLGEMHLVRRESKPAEATYLEAIAQTATEVAPDDPQVSDTHLEHRRHPHPALSLAEGEGSTAPGPPRIAVNPPVQNRTHLNRVWTWDRHGP